MFLLIVLALEKLFAVVAAAPPAFAWFYWLWTPGFAVTGGMLLVKGTLMDLGADAGCAAFAGIAKTGHLCLTIAGITLFVALRAALKQGEVAGAPAPALADR